MPTNRYRVDRSMLLSLDSYNNVPAAFAPW